MGVVPPRRGPAAVARVATLGDDMLELGPGPGAATEWLREGRAARRQSSSTRSRRSSSRAVRRAPTWRCASGTRPHLRFEDATFDAVGSSRCCTTCPRASSCRRVLVEAPACSGRTGLSWVRQPLQSAGCTTSMRTTPTTRSTRRRSLTRIQAAGFVPDHDQGRPRHQVCRPQAAATSPSGVAPTANRSDEQGECPMTLPYEEPLVPRARGSSGPRAPSSRRARRRPVRDLRRPATDALWSDDLGRSTRRSVAASAARSGSRAASTPTRSRTSPRQRPASFGPVVARVERGILALGDVARVHLYRWGDGGAHFHVWLIPAAARDAGGERDDAAALGGRAPQRVRRRASSCGREGRGSMPSGT